MKQTHTEGGRFYSNSWLQRLQSTGIVSFESGHSEAENYRLTIFGETHFYLMATESESRIHSYFPQDLLRVVS